MISTKDMAFYYPNGEEIKKEIWRTGDTLYYRQGVTDPDYCVLKFTAIKGRHYYALKTESFTVKDLK